MLLKLIWTLAMLLLAGYAQARARHAMRGLRGGAFTSPWGKAGRSLRGIVFLAWACLFVLTATAVWISWLWAIALLGMSAVPPLAAKALGDRFNGPHR